MRKADLDHRFWVVIKDLSGSMIVKHRWSGEIKVINK